MNLFLDTSVILAACGSSGGASRFVLSQAERQNWALLTSAYVIREVEANLGAVPGHGNVTWDALRSQLIVVPDVLTFEWVTVFTSAKDRPILFTALAWADALLTLDRADFGELIGTEFYGLAICTPGQFLLRERAAKRLQKGKMSHE